MGGFPWRIIEHLTGFSNTLVLLNRLEQLRPLVTEGRLSILGMWESWLRKIDFDEVHLPR